MTTTRPVNRAAATHTIVASPVGDLTLVASDGVLSGLYMPQHRRNPHTDLGTRVRPDAGCFGQVHQQLCEYFAGHRRTFDLPLHLAGNDFQRRVWHQLTQTPYGQTRSYGQIAEVFGGGYELARAVGAANAANPIAIIVPCHRVIAADGSLHGYAGGPLRKRFLLDLESAVADAELAQPALWAGRSV